MRKNALLLATVLALGLVAGACGGDEPTTIATPTQTTPTESPAASPTASPAAADDEVQVALQDFAFFPPDITIASGGKIEITNGGAAPHTFTLTDTDIDVTVQPGEDASVDVTLDPGTYDLMCRFHAEMTGTVTVTG